MGFDFNKITEYDAIMENLGVETLVFNQEPRVQFGIDENGYYLDEWNGKKFVSLVECGNLKGMKIKVANWFLNK